MQERDEIARHRGRRPPRNAGEDRIAAADRVRCHTATDGDSARESIHHYKPDVAVLDFVMPLVNGIELTKELCMNGHSTQVVICSVENDQETIEAARSAGELGYVFKPRMAKDLASAVKSAAAGRPFTAAE